MLIVQHAWSRWTKALRGAGAGRPRLQPPYPLIVPQHAPASGVWRHEVRVLEQEGFAHLERAGDSRSDIWHQPPCAFDNLSWRQAANGMDLRLNRPSELLTTPWPSFIGTIPLRQERIIRIDWNGRFHASMSGSNRSYLFEQHSYLLAFSDTPTDDFFLMRAPDKVIDLTTRLY